MSANLSEENLEVSRKIETSTKMDTSTNNEASTNLHLAAKENNLEKLIDAIEKLKSEGGDIDQQNNSGDTALSLVVQNKDKKDNLEMIVRLIEHGANIKHNLGKEQNPIWQACRTGNIEAIKSFITYNPDNMDIEYSMSAALIHGQVEIVKYLKPFFEDKLWSIQGCLDSEGNTAAHIAAKTDNLAMLQYLKEQEVDFNVILKEGGLELNVLMTAVKYGSTSILMYLHQCNFSFKHKDNLKNDAVLLAVKYDQRPSLSFLFDNNIELSVDIPYKKYTLFLYAANLGFVDIMDLLLEKNKNVIHDKDSEGNNALLIATEKGHLHVIEFLRKRFGLREINTTNHSDQNAIVIAIQLKRPEILKYLIRYGLTIKYAARFLVNALSNRNSNDIPNDECVIILKAVVKLQSLCKLNITSDTSIRNLIADINNALSQGAHVNQRDDGLRTPLHWAAINGNEVVFQILVEDVVKQFKNRSGILKCKDNQGKSPLQLAQEKGHLKLVSLFYVEYLQELIQDNQLNKIPEVYKDAIEFLFIPLNKFNSEKISGILNSTTSIEEMIDKNIKNIFNFWEKTKSIPGIKSPTVIFDHIFKFVNELSNTKGYLESYNDGYLKYLKTRTYIHLARIFNSYGLNAETVRALNFVISLTEKPEDLNRLKLYEDFRHEAHAMLGELYCTGRVNSLNHEIRSEAQIIETMLDTKDLKGLEDNEEEFERKNKAENESNIALGLIHYCQAGRNNPSVADERRIWTNRFRNKTMSNFTLGDPLNPNDLIGIMQDANRIEDEANKKIAQMEIELQQTKEKAKLKENELQAVKIELDQNRQKLLELALAYQKMNQNNEEFSKNNTEILTMNTLSKNKLLMSANKDNGIDDQSTEQPKEQPVKQSKHGTKRTHEEMLDASQTPASLDSKSKVSNELNGTNGDAQPHDQPSLSKKQRLL